MLSSGPIMKEGKHGMPVLGMGGLFFRAHDPDALNAWYRTIRGTNPERPASNEEERAA